MKRVVLLLAIFSASSSFDNSLKYACNEQKCVYKFIVPETLSAYIDPQIFTQDFQNLTVSLQKLGLAVANDGVPDDNNAFIEAFNGDYNTAEPNVNATVTNVTNIDSADYENLKNNSGILLQLSTKLQQMGDCLVAGSTTNLCAKIGN